MPPNTRASADYVQLVLYVSARATSHSLLCAPTHQSSAPQVAAGLAASIIVVDCSSATKEGEAGKAALGAGKWPLYDPAGDQAIAAAWKGGKGGAAAGAGGAAEAEEPISGKKRSAGAAGAKGKATGGTAPKKGRK